MSVQASITDDTLTIRVPLALRRRGGRKLVVTPDGKGWAPRRPEVNGALVKALARAFRWQRLIENGTYASIAELAAAERINSSYVSRVLRLTLLAPDIVESILDGRHDPETVTLERLMKPMPVVWSEQQRDAWPLARSDQGLTLLDVISPAL